ncbi:MAG: substrate-binding domain-containing protein [Pirellulaceae bacterium]
MKSSVRFLFVVLLALLVASGCRRDPPTFTTDAAGTSETTRTIGYSAMTLTNPFFKVIADTMTDEAKQHGYEVQVVSADGNVKKQSDQIDDFIVKGVSVIVLNPVDSHSIGPAIQRANKAGIPVFTNDLGYAGNDAEIVSHIATDNLQGGQLVGQAMVKAIGDSGGKVAIVDYPQAESCQLRVKGFMESIDAHNAEPDSAKIEVVARLDGGGDLNQGHAATKDIIESNPDLAGLFAINDPSAQGAYQALVAAGKAEQVTIVGFDGQEDAKKAILRGEILCDGIQYPDKIGRITIEQIIAHFSGEEVESEVLIPSGLYYKEDVEKEFGSAVEAEAEQQ